MGHLMDNCLANVCQICIGSCCSRITIMYSYKNIFGYVYMIDINVFNGKNVHMLSTWLVVITTCCLLIGGFLFTSVIYN